MAMVGDGKTEYDVGKDGADQEAGACSVRYLRIRVLGAADLKLTVHTLLGEYP